jgi:hypothetical protein
VLGRHSLAGLNGQVLQETRRLVKSIGDHRAQSRLKSLVQSETSSVCRARVSPASFRISVS